ncbi:hypothetical protein D9M68_961550 [compost metagenome]
MDDELAARANCFLIFGKGSRVSSPVKLDRDFEVDFTIPPKSSSYSVHTYCVSMDGESLLDRREMVDVGRNGLELIEVEKLEIPK